MQEPGDPDFFEFLALNNMLMYMSDVESEDIGESPRPADKPHDATTPSIGGCVLFAAVIVVIIIVAAAL
ncbi:MAG TPA: hypothetical protein PKH33_17465 [bacterium]|nr:hypothetical protein [bacterium]